MSKGYNSAYLDYLEKAISCDENSDDKVSEASVTSTQPLYEDEDGNEFTVTDLIVKGFRPKGKYKGKSLADRVMSPDFGKVKKND